MGFNVDLVAVRGLPATELHARLQLEPTANSESEPESPVVGASLPSGWEIVYFNDRSPPTEAELAVLSGSAEVVFLDVCEMATICTAKCWKSGKILWSISHDSQRGTDHLEAEGEKPGCFPSIADRLRQCQAANGDADRIDYIFNVPAEVFAAITGFSYDGNPDGFPVDSFVVFRREKPSRKWWHFW
jgi:hypothetical protein